MQRERVDGIHVSWSARTLPLIAVVQGIYPVRNPPVAGRPARTLSDMQLRITTEKVGNVWVGGVEGYPEIAERALSKEAAEAKARQMARRIERGDYNPLRRRKR